MLRYFRNARPEHSTLAELGSLLLRVFAGGAMALTHGLKKCPPSDKLIEGIADLGFPLAQYVAWLVMSAELLGGIALALGFCTRLSSFALVVTMAVAAFGAHASDPFAKKEMALLYGAIALYFLLRGSGAASIDGMWKGASRRR